MNSLYGKMIFILFFSVFVSFAIGGCSKGNSPDKSNSKKSLPLSDSLAVIKAQGSLGTLKFANGESRPLQAAPQEAPPGTKLELEQRKSKCSSTFPTGGKIEFIGRASVELREKGFFTERGKFVAAFARQNKVFYQVFTPTAVFGVKGTRIAFNLEAGAGQVTLLDGKAGVYPPGKPEEEKEISPGQIVFLDSPGFDRSDRPINIGGPPSQQEGGGTPGGTPGGDQGDPMQPPGMLDSQRDFEVYQEDELGTAAERIMDKAGGNK